LQASASLGEPRKTYRIREKTLAMTWRLRRFATCLLSAILGALLVGCSGKKPPERVLVGQLVPLSGVDKAIGEQAEHGAALAVEELNQNATRRPIPRMEVLHVDTLGDAEKVAPEAVRVIKFNEVAALLGGTDAAQAGPLARTAQAYGVPTVLSSGPAGQPLGEDVFCVGLSPATRGRALAQAAATELHVARAAVLADDRRPAGLELATAFARELAHRHGSQPNEWTYQGEAEFAELVGRLRQRKEPPQAVLIASGVRDFIKLRAQLEKAGLRAALLFGGEEAAGTALLADREASQGVYFATAYITGHGGPREQDFVPRYKERFQTAPNVHAALAYDGARLLGDAAHSLAALEPGKVRGFLNGLTSFEGLTGPLTFRKDHYARREVFIVRCEEGQLKLITRVAPEEESARTSPQTCLSPVPRRCTLMGKTSARSVMAGPWTANRRLMVPGHGDASATRASTLLGRASAWPR
jgi:branched-chain amino acid transport system substrate-binding protein